MKERKENTPINEAGSVTLTKYGMGLRKVQQLMLSAEGYKVLSACGSQ